MREVKFRVYVDKTAKMLDWMELQKIKQFALDDGIKPKDIILLPVNEGTHLMQYIGIEDLFGKDIYEDDIVKYSYIAEGEEEVFTVEFSVPCFKFRSHHDNNLWNISEYDFNRLEVIGNIYENKELL